MNLDIKSELIKIGVKLSMIVLAIAVVIYYLCRNAIR